MTSDDLTDVQKMKLRAKVESMRGYLNQVIVRMAEQGFPQDDPLWKLVTRITDDMLEVERVLATRPPAAHGKGPENS